jgi:AcrR family transcriptional regulator
MTAAHEGLRSIKKRMTRELIAEAALQLTLEKGLENVTADEIAYVAFISPRTVSNYFSCKEEAVVAAGSLLPELVENYMHSPKDAAPLEALRGVITGFFHARTDEQIEQVRQRLLLTEKYPSLLTFQMASVGQAERDLREIIAERTGADADHDLHPSLTACAAISAVQAAVWVWARSEAPAERLAELMATAFDYIQNGLDATRDLSIGADRHSAEALVAEAVTFARDAQADAAAQAVTETVHAVAAAAEKTADAAEMARLDRASAAAVAASAVAATAASAAAAAQLQADASATKLSEATARAVAIVAADNAPGSEREGARTALRMAATAEALAIATAEDTAAAAARVASAVSEAASGVAFNVSELDKAIEDEVARVAAALRTKATAIARQVAADTHARATDVALIAREAAAAAAAALDLKDGSGTQESVAAVAAPKLAVMTSATLVPVPADQAS